MTDFLNHDFCGGVRTACPVHMSNVTAFASALAANVCVAVDSSMAFCFVKDVETEQLLGAYASRHCCFPHPDCPPSETQNSSCECSHATSQSRMASCVQRSSMCASPEDTAHLRNCCSFLTREPGEAPVVPKLPTYHAAANSQHKHRRFTEGTFVRAPQ